MTLIELLVVVTIVSIMALGIGLTGGGVFARPSDSARSLADRFDGAVTQARDRAVLGRRLVGLRPRPDGWMIVEPGRSGDWQPVGAPVRARRASMAWQIDGQTFLPRLASAAADRRPAVIFAPDGRATPLRLVIGQPGARIACATDPGGGVTCD